MPFTPKRLKKVKYNTEKSYIIRLEVADLFNAMFDNFIEYDNVCLLLKNLINKVFPVELLGQFNMRILHLSLHLIFPLTYHCRSKEICLSEAF